MTRGRTALAVALGAAALVCALAAQDAVRLAASEKAPYFSYGRREIPGANDPYFIAEAGPDAPERDGDVLRLSYTALVWSVHSLCAIEDDAERRRLYREAERLYAAILAETARAKEPDAALRSNAQFLIAAAWVAWKGSLDTLARDRLKSCAASKAGQYRLAAEMMSEKTPYRAGLDVAVGKLLAGDAAAALEKLNDVVRRQPDDRAAHYWRGVALHRLDRHDEAIAALDASLKVDAGNVEALEARAACHVAKKDWAAARSDWEAAVARDPVARGRLQPWIDAARERGR